MNYFNVDAVDPVPIYVRTGWGENTYSEMWEYFEIKYFQCSVFHLNSGIDGIFRI